MGASGWSYIVPYQPEINTALQRLRQEVFESGQYEKRDHSEWRSIDEGGFRKRIASDPLEIQEILLDEWRYIKNLPEPDTIERLLNWNQESGTHSILDIYKGVSQSVASGTVSPLTERELTNLFGTTRPNHHQVADWLDKMDLHNLRRRWHGLYIIVYDGDVPTEICFAGFSGD
jgi:hypothetical protein